MSDSGWFVSFTTGWFSGFLTTVILSLFLKDDYIIFLDRIRNAVSALLG